jgi:predicted Zn-dependent protease
MIPRLGFLAAFLLIAGCGRGPSGPSIVVRDDAQYNRALAEARALSEVHVKSFAVGASLQEADLADLRKAAQLFDALIDYKPTFFALHFGSGQIEHALGNTSRARQRFLQSIELAPRPESVETMVIVADAHFGLSQLDFLNRDYAGAERRIRESLERFPDNASYWAALASIQIERRELAAARTSIDRSLRLDPDQPTANRLRRLLAFQRLR